MLLDARHLFTWYPISGRLEHDDKGKHTEYECADVHRAEELITEITGHTGKMSWAQGQRVEVRK